MAAKVIEITAQDIEALARLVKAEAESIVLKGYSEKEAYATIIDSIINRAAAESYSVYKNKNGSIQEIIDAKSGTTYQFTALQESTNGSWSGLPSAEQSIKDFVKQHLQDRVNGEHSTVGEATHYFNETRANPSWGSEMEDALGVGESPYDENGNLKEDAESHTFGNPLRSDGTFEPKPKDYIIKVDLDEDNELEAGETSPEFTGSNNTKLPSTFITKLDPPISPDAPAYKPDRPDADKLNGLNPGAGDGDASNDDDLPQKTEENMEVNEAKPSPLVLDLDGDGIELTSLASSNAVYWDHNVDGFAEASGWVTGGDGFLAIDLNNDGIINNSSELFGNQTGKENGFLALATYDSNLDGQITSLDEVWSQLRVWIDTSMEGYSQSDELHSLDNLLITSINLAYTDVNYILNGNNIGQESSFTINGNTHDIVDAYFSVNKSNAVYNQEFILDPRTRTLPNLKGYGEIASLQIAMSIDNESGGLLDMVTDLINQNITDLLSSANLVSDVRAIMHRWAGVDGISPTSRGPNIDARDLAFLEKLTGEEFLQLGYLSNPRPQAGKGMVETFDNALDKILSRLVLQGSAGQIFEETPIYNFATGNLETLGDFSTDFLDDLVDASLTAPDKMVFWENVLRIVVNAKGESNMTPTDINDLNTAIYLSDSALSYTIVHASVFDVGTTGITIHGDNTDNTINGTFKYDKLYGNGGNDTIYGDVGDDYIEGDDGNDTISGGYGDDVIYGDSGNDHLSGNQGNDLLFGGSGDDTYYYNLGDGYDTIRETTNTQLNDKIIFGAGISISDLTFSRLSNNDLSILINASGGQGEIVVENQFSTSSSTGSIETLVFSDTSTFDLASLNFTLTGTNAAETLYGVTFAGQNADTIYGDGGNDVIYGYTGADTLYGGDGNDTIYGGGTVGTYYTETDTNTIHGDAGNDKIYGSYGIDHIHGGTGNDTLRGNLGNDEYYFNLGDGNDTITEIDASGHGTIDTLNFGEGIDVNDVTIIREGSYNLKIMINGGQDGSITIIDQFKTSSGAGAIEYIKFHDTTVWNLTTMGFGLVATDAAETIHGNNSGSGSPDDIIYAEGGNDIIYGYLGADQLHGGDGNDTIYAGSSLSTYLSKTTTNYLYGDAGNDAIYGAYGIDHIYGGAGDDTLRGMLGNDHYYYSRAQGNDIIEDQGAVSGANNIDTLHLDESISASDLTYVRDGNYNLKIMINGGSGGSITLIDQFATDSSAKAVEFIQLSDSTQIDLRNMNFVLTATAASETLHGTEVNSLKNDTIYGGSGNDAIYGYFGIDTLYGGDGNDTIHGGSSTSGYFSETDSNYLYGEAGSDTIWGSNGVDYIYGGADNDTLYGRAGADQYYYAQGEGDDIITETGKTDVDILNFDSSIESSEISYIRVGNTDLKILINGGAGGSILLSGQFSTGGSDAGVEIIKLHDNSEIDLRTLNYTLTGTSANESLNGTLIYSGGVDLIYGGGGNDTIQGYLGVDTLYGGDGNDIIHGGGSTSGYFSETDSNYLYGEAGSDTIWGSYGVDYIYGGADNDTLSGRLGADQYYYAQGEGDDIITETGKTDIDVLNFDSSIEASEISYIRVGNTDLKILINGGAGGSILLAGQFSTGGSDAGVEIIKLHGNTEIDLRTLNYTLTGTSANESLNGTLVYSGGVDLIYGGGGNDTIQGYLGSDTLYGGDGNDIIHGGGSSSGYFSETDSNYLYGEAGSDTIWGSYGVDYIYGGADNDTLSGRLGADQYYYAQGEGDDIITETGKTDIDVLNFDSSIEASEISYIRVGNTDLKILINGGAGGSILLAGQFSTGGSDAGVEIIKLHDNSEIDLRTLNYTLTGTSAGESLNGTLVYSGGVDLIYGGGGNDTIQGYLGIDTLYGGDGNDTIHGGGSTSGYFTETDSNYLYGEAGTDTLYGSHGNDFLYGGDGSDTLTGRNGADTFVFLNGETGTDTITDFNVGQGDALDLSDLLSEFDPLTDAITDFVWISESGGKSNVFVDKDGLGSTYSLTAVAILNGVTGITDEAALVTNGNLIIT